MITRDELRCPEKGVCFAKCDNGNCAILQDTSFKTHCPFQKKERSITNGKRYPYMQMQK